jgi:hypothetical protein
MNDISNKTFQKKTFQKKRHFDKSETFSDQEKCHLLRTFCFHMNFCHKKISGNDQFSKTILFQNNAKKCIMVKREYKKTRNYIVVFPTVAQIEQIIFRIEVHIKNRTILRVYYI